MPKSFDLSNYTRGARRIFQRAEQLASDLNHRRVRSEHVVVSLLEDDSSWTVELIASRGADPNELGRVLVDELEGIRRSRDAPGRVVLSDELVRVLKSAQSPGDEPVGLSAFLEAVARDQKSRTGRLLRERGINADAIESFSGEQSEADVSASADDSATDVLSKFSEDLTGLAEREELDPVIGRDQQIRRILQVLARRVKNNPVLIGEPGVGKTAIVEGLAQRMVAGDVPDGLIDTKLVSLDLGSLVAGTSLRGEFEERMNKIIDEVTGATNIILVIDEIHQLVGAGGQGSSMNASNLLKPALARGELSVIGTTTVDEYREYIEDDAALERRFQSIDVDEVSVDGCISILRGIKQRYEIHHGIQIADSALRAAAEMTDRYVTDRALPDKAIDAMDEAASRIRLQIDSRPHELDRLLRQLEKLEVEKQSLTDAQEPESVEAREQLDERIGELREESHDLEDRWEREKQKLDELSELKEELEETEKDIAKAKREGEVGRSAELKHKVVPEIESRISKVEKQLEEINEDERLLKDHVDESDVGAVIADWTGIPVSKMLESEREKLLNMPDRIRRRVVGQDHAIESISQAIWRSRAGLRDPNRPIGSFMFVGPTGVGKTELAKALSEYLFDSEDALIRIDMSEYMEQSKVNTLIGSARGYVGSEEGGVLTEAVRHNPYSVVLFDETEKAHPDVFNLLLQMMDEGRLTDSQGREVDFTNTLIILTSNVGSRRILDLAGQVSEQQLSEEVEEILKDHFRPEFLNRLDDQIVFRALDKDVLRKIIKIQERDLQGLLADRDISLTLTEGARDLLIDVGYEPEYGARPLQRAIGEYIQDPLSRKILEGEFGEGDSIVVDIGAEEQKLVFEKEAITKRKAG
jgi:ATP-dependent Clp protease ATP-binding subunit ClpB